MKGSLFISVFAFISILICLVHNLNCVPIEPSYLITTKILITTPFFLLKFNNGSLVPHPPLICPHPRLIIIIYQCIYPRIYLLKTACLERKSWLIYVKWWLNALSFILKEVRRHWYLLNLEVTWFMIKYPCISCVGFLPSPLLWFWEFHIGTHSACGVGALERSDASVSYVLPLVCLLFFLRLSFLFSSSLSSLSPLLGCQWLPLASVGIA